jgi:hypothetical protein
MSKFYAHSLEFVLVLELGRIKKPNKKPVFEPVFLREFFLYISSKFFDCVFNRNNFRFFFTAFFDFYSSGGKGFLADDQSIRQAD